MAKLYLSAVEFVKKREFEVFIPAYYDPNTPSEMINRTPRKLERPNSWKSVSTRRRDTTPFYQPLSHDQIVKSAFSLEGMLVMFHKQVEFELVYEEEIVEVFDGIDRYLVSLKVDVEMGSERVIDYVNLMLKWRAEVYKHYYRFMKMNPSALERLYPNNDPTQNLLYLMKMGGGLRSNEDELDPLRARAKPPYSVEAIVPKEAVEDVRIDIGSSLGLSSDHVINDDGRDFNFDDFLKR